MHIFLMKWDFFVGYDSLQLYIQINLILTGSLLGNTSTILSENMFKKLHSLCLPKLVNEKFISIYDPQQSLCLSSLVYM